MRKTILSLTTFLCLPTVPDILPDGMKGITLEVSVTAGGFTDTACVQHVVMAHETLFAIAAKRLGDGKRWPEIQLLNPDLQGDKLTPGQRLWLPPKTPPAASAEAKERLYLFLDRSVMFRTDLVPVALDERVQPTRGIIALYAVPASLRAELEKRPEKARDLATAGKVLLAEGQQLGRLVPTGSPVSKRHDAWRLDLGADGKLRMTATSTRFDKDGKQLPDAPAPEAKTEPEPKKEMLLLGLALVGGLLLMARARRTVGKPALA